MKNTHIYLGVVLASLLTVGCSTVSTNFKPFEGKSDVVEGKGGTKVVVDGMEIWENGDPPRKYKVIGIIEDSRGGGLPMNSLKEDMVEKAREAGGDALIQGDSESEITGYAPTYAGMSGTLRKNHAKFTVIKYVK